MKGVRDGSSWTTLTCSLSLANPRRWPWGRKWWSFGCCSFDGPDCDLGQPSSLRLYVRSPGARELATAGRSVADIARALDVSRATVYRMLADERPVD